MPQREGSRGSQAGVLAMTNPRATVPAWFVSGRGGTGLESRNRSRGPGGCHLTGPLTGQACLEPSVQAPSVSRPPHPVRPAQPAPSTSLLSWHLDTRATMDRGNSKLTIAPEEGGCPVGSQPRLRAFAARLRRLLFLLTAHSGRRFLFPFPSSLPFSRTNRPTPGPAWLRRNQGRTRGDRCGHFRTLPDILGRARAPSGAMRTVWGTREIPRSLACRRGQRRPWVPGQRGSGCHTPTE